jgi:hypothetical protein
VCRSNRLGTFSMALRAARRGVGAGGASPCLRGMSNWVLGHVRAPPDQDSPRLTWEQQVDTRVIGSDIQVMAGFISVEEEARLARYFHGLLCGGPYSVGHWDGVAKGFREVRCDMSDLPEDIGLPIKRLEGLFRPGAKIVPSVHALDLSEDAGEITSHVDHVRFCGEHIVGLCLLSEAIMRFDRKAPAELEEDTLERAGFERGEGGEWRSKEGYGVPGAVVDALLPRRCAYVMRGALRYGFGHAVLGGRQLFGSEAVPVQRRRRLSLVLRDEVPLDLQR